MEQEQHREVKEMDEKAGEKRPRLMSDFSSGGRTEEGELKHTQMHKCRHNPLFLLDPQFISLLNI